VVDGYTRSENIPPGKYNKVLMAGRCPIDSAFSPDEEAGQHVWTISQERNHIFKDKQKAPIKSYKMV